MPDKIILAGGSGFLGRALAASLVAGGAEVVVLSRRTEDAPAGGRVVSWDGRTIGPWVAELEGASALVNLAGASINCVHTETNRALIRRSRVDAVAALGAAVRACQRPPAVWVQCSAVGYYGGRSDGLRDEAAPAGDDFLAEVCRAWEDAFAAARLPGQRGVVLRLGVVLGREGGALPPLLRLTRAFLGGAAGSGEQGMSWIHVADVVAILQRAVADAALAGIYNACAPEPVTNAAFMAALRRACHRPWAPPAPAWAVRLAARHLLGTDPSLILTGPRAVPARLGAAGFVFRYAGLPAALADLAGRGD